MRIVSLEMLTPDMVLAKSIRKGAQIYIEEGRSNINKYVKNLKHLGIQYVYIEDGTSEGIEIPDVISAETRDRCKDVLRESVMEMQKNNTLQVNAVESVMDVLIHDVFTNADVQISLLDISIADEYTFSHSVSMTVYALLMANEMNYSKVQIEKLAMGTLLHDIGKTVLDQKILFKEGRLTEEEFAYVKSHTTKGYEILKKCGGITDLSGMIALTHHERLDGSGYPNGITRNETHEFTKIAAIADVYDALTADRCYRSKWAPDRAADYLLMHADTWFDSKLLLKFVQHIAIYPNGSMVELSDGRVGLVVRQHKNIPTRPVVRIIAERGKRIARPYYEVDLINHRNLVICKSQLENVEIK